MAVERKWTLNPEQTNAFHNFDARECPQADLVDDLTWSDLEMEKVFVRIDKSITPLGAQFLYSLLRVYQRKPEQSAEWAQSRDAFLANAQAQASLRRALLEMNREDSSGLAGFIFGPPQITPPHWEWYGLLPAATILSLCGLLVSPLFIFVAMGFFIINIGVNYIHRDQISRHGPSLVPVGTLLLTARRLAEQPALAKSAEAQELRGMIDKIKKVHKKISRVFLRGQAGGDIFTILVEYLNLILLFEFLSCCRALEAINNERAVLGKTLRLVGRLDALQGLALALPEFPHYCVPEIQPGPAFDLVDAYHPLIDSPVCNSISGTDRSVLLLGTNMAGKTTFMKTLAINLLLAHTLGICLARKAVLPPARVRSLINRDDTTTSGQSYFFYEAKELLRMLKDAEASGGEYWFVVDEIFRGTNTIERIAAGSAVLGNLASRWTVFASTHDGELVKLLAGEFDPYHFSEVVTEAGPCFDYLLKHGPCPTRNAIKLLVLAGYPATVTDLASQLARAADPPRPISSPAQ